MGARFEIPEYQNAVVYISSNDIKEEISGATVIFDAPNMDKDIRIHYIELAESAKISEKELHVMQCCPGYSAVDTTEINQQQSMYEFFCRNYPSFGEGWSRILEHEQERELALEIGR